MASLLRGRQAGVQRDFSSGVTEDFFVLDDLRRFGVSSRITELAYDPVQSLLAVGTAATSFGPGQIYVYGRSRIGIVFPLPSPKASVRTLQFCSDKLICLDDRNDFSIYSLVSKKMVATYAPPGAVACMTSDPTLDFVMLGMHNGDILAYDLDREAIAPFRLPCFWSELNPRARSVPIVTMEFHPRDIGTLLIGYTDGACIYSFKQNKPIKFFHYQVPRGAPGGDGNPALLPTERHPKLTHAIWHPTGTFILTGHEDGSLVFWDPRDGRIVQARSLFDTNVNRPVSSLPGGAADNFVPKTPLLKIAWCANKDPDDTGILVAGGADVSMDTRGMTFLELGRTPNYVTSSWQILSDYVEKPKRERMLPTPPGVEVINFCLLPRATPWYAGAHDPLAILAVLSSGELTTLSFPSGYPISPTNQLNISLTFVHPFVNRISHASVERGRWLGLTENRSSGPKFLKGGAEAAHPMKRFENRSILQTAHADGSIRLWDAGHADEIENETVLQADVSRAVGRLDGLNVTATSFSGASSEFTVGLESGEVVIFRWAHNKHPGQEPPRGGHNEPGGLTDVSSRKDPSLVEGLHPFTLLNEQNGPVTVVKTSDVGFIAAGFQGGALVVMDMRGPAIIFKGHMGDFMRKEHRTSLRRKRESTGSLWPTAIEFSVMQVEDDSYSSILLHVGTNNGSIATFKLLPNPRGGYGVDYAGFTQMDGEVILLSPLNAATGQPAYASQAAVGGLASGRQIDGVLLAVSRTEAKLFKPATSRGASKSWDGGLCQAAAVTQCLDLGKALVCLLSDGTARAYSIPGLSQIGKFRIDNKLDMRRISEAVITESGDVFGWTGPSELALLNVWGTGSDKQVEDERDDRIFNPEALIPPRPTISAVQWVSGTQYITPSDLDILIGGPNRPPSKRMIAQARADELQRKQAAREQGSASRQLPPGEQETYWGYMQRQIQERTERLGIMNDSVDRLEENSRGWVEDVNDYISKQKRNMVMGAVKSKFGI